MALPGKGKKRTTTQKSSALSKRHKASVKPESSTKTKSFKETPAVEKVPRAKTAFPADKASKEKKDRKGKGPLFIPAVEQDSSDDDSDGAMELDEEIDGEQGDFLMALDEKGMAVYGSFRSFLDLLELIRYFFDNAVLVRLSSQAIARTSPHPSLARGSIRSRSRFRRQRC